MKLSLLIVAILGVAAVTAVPTGKSRSARSIKDELADFWAIIDEQEMANVIMTYVYEDAEVQAAIGWLLSNWDSLKETLSAIPELTDLKDRLEAAGIDISDLNSRVREYISGLVGSYEPVTITGGFSGLWADLKACLPLDELRALFQEKLETSEDFARVYEYLRSLELQEIVEKVKENAYWQSFCELLESHGIDIEAVIDWVKNLIGWS